jgi:hypothetical protein
VLFRSKFSMIRLANFAVDGLLSFSKVPLRLSFFLGAAVAALGFLLAGFGVWQVVGKAAPLEPGATAVLAALHLIGGAILCAIGLAGEYVGRIYEQVKGRPLYLLKESWPDTAFSEDSKPVARPEPVQRVTARKAR